MGFHQSPPETLGRLIQTIMSTAEEDDFSAIIKILESAQSEHELKWILRNVVENSGKTDAEKGEAIQEGIRKVLVFGTDSDALKGAQQVFQNTVKDLFDEKSITY